MGNQVNQTVHNGMAHGADFTAGQRPGTDASYCRKCGATRIDSQIGLERTPDEYVAKIVAVFREVWRVLRDDGVCFVNLGDSYAGNPAKGASGNGKESEYLGDRESTKQMRRPLGNLKPKDLVGIPWRIAFALQAAGWYLRSDIIWSKPNPMPESVTDRPTKSHEYIFLLTKRERYFFDQDAVREDSIDPESFSGRSKRLTANIVNHDAGYDGHRTKVGLLKLDGQTYPTRNIRTVWEISTQPYPEAHFATFPEEIAKRCILAGTSERGACKECGAPWGRVTEIDYIKHRPSGGKQSRIERGNKIHDDGFGSWGTFGTNLRKVTETLGWQPTCKHDAPTRGCMVLDPFTGSGTVVQVAQDLGRIGIGVDMKMEYLKMAKRRSAQLGFGHVFGNNGVATDEVAAAG